MAFKDNLREEIEYRGLLVKELSAKAGISNSTFLSYIDSRGVLPNVETGVKIAKALDVSVEYLVTGQKEKAAENEKTDSIIREINRDLESLKKEELVTVQKMLHALVV